MTESVAILGAGLAGLVLADRLSARGIDVAVFEREPEVGGLARGVAIDGSRVDLGPHNVRAKWPEVLAYYRELLGDDLLPRSFTMKILFRGKILSYPVKPLEVLRELPSAELLRCGLSFGAARLRKKGSVGSFAEWARSHYGQALFECFFAPLTEKIWSVPSEELDTRLAQDRVPAPNRGKRLHGEDPKASPHFYPRLGVAQFVDRLLERLAGRGVRIHTGARVTAVREESAGVRLDVDGRRRQFSYLASSIPLPSLAAVHAGLRGLKWDRMRYRGLGLAYLSVDRGARLSGPFTLTAEREVPFTRATDFSYCSEDCLAAGRNVIALEYAVPDATQLVARGTRAVEGFLNLGWIRREAVKETRLVHQPVVYPVYLTGHRDQWRAAVERLADQPRLISLGRQGVFSHSNIDDVMAGAFAVDDLLKGAGAVDPEAKRRFYVERTGFGGGRDA